MWKPRVSNSVVVACHQKTRSITEPEVLQFIQNGCQEILKALLHPSLLPSVDLRESNSGPQACVITVCYCDRRPDKKQLLGERVYLVYGSTGDTVHPGRGDMAVAV